jgi:mannose-6-phosphate isomerase
MLPPLRFVPIAKARPWGAARLASLGKPTLPGTAVGETWEVADLPDSIADGQSHVASGPFAGQTLRALRQAHRDDLLGIATPAPDGAFPLLVKFLDAADNLSLQVHPVPSYVAQHPDTHVKNEAWIIVQCEPGARVYRGIRPETSREQFAADLAAGRALDHIESFEVSPGDCVYLPSGVCHALGAGILAAEVQTPSDTTFRVWDWNRNAPSRPLHLEQAWQCMRFGGDQFDGTKGFVRSTDAPRIEANGVVTRRLCRSPYFSVDSLDCMRTTEIPFAGTGVPEVWMTLRGSARVRAASDSFEAQAGATVLLPGRVEDGCIEASAGTMLLRMTCASPLDRAT